MEFNRATKKNSSNSPKQSIRLRTPGIKLNLTIYDMLLFQFIISRLDGIQFSWKITSFFSPFDCADIIAKKTCKYAYDRGCAKVHP